MGLFRHNLGLEFGFQSPVVWMGYTQGLPDTIM